MKTVARKIVKKLSGYLMIELFVPGGTLVILGLLVLGAFFPTAQERLRAALPTCVGGLIRLEHARADQPKSLPVVSADSDPAAR